MLVKARGTQRLWNLRKPSSDMESGGGGQQRSRIWEIVVRQQGARNPLQNVQTRRSRELRELLNVRPGAPSQHRNEAHYLVLGLSQKAKKQRSMLWSQRPREPGACYIYSCIYTLPGSRKSIRHLTRTQKVQGNTNKS